MSRIQFRDSDLGPWASHPATLSQRARKWAAISFLPLAVGLLLFLFAWRFGALSLLTLAKQWDTWLPLVLALVALGFSAAVTCLLVARASTVAAFQGRSAGPRTLKIWSFVAATGLVSALAFLLTRSDFLGAALSANGVARVRIAGHLLGTLPVFALLVYLEFAGKAVDEWGEGSSVVGWRVVLRRCYMVLTILAGYVLPMVWIDRIAAALDSYLDHLRDPQTVSADSVAETLLRWVPWLQYDKAAAAGNTLLNLVDSAQQLLSVIAILVPLACMTGFVVTAALSFVRRAPTAKQPVDANKVAMLEGYNVRPAGEAWAPNSGDSRPAANRWIPASEAEAAAGGEEAADAVAQPASDAEPETQPSPEWLAKVRELAAKKLPLEWGTARPLPAPECSPTSNRSDLAHLFATAYDRQTGATLPPTKDQAGALEQFDQIFERFMESEDHEGRCVFPSLDLLVKGQPGSGRTTLLLAVAMNSVVLRGQSVLILVPTHEKADLFVCKLRDLASRSGVGWHVSVGRILSDDVRSWADPLDVRAGSDGKQESFRSPVGSAPDILVGTPQDYEQHLFGADAHYAVVRRAMLRLQVVLVEDLTSFDASERRHLPFLLEKHRLVLSSEHLPVQFLALAPDLTEFAADYLTERLFSERAPVPCVRLRPPQRHTPWKIDVAAEDTNEALEALAAASKASGVQVVVWRPGSEPGDRKKMEELLGGARVVGDLDELAPEDGWSTDLALYRSMTGQQHTLALAARLPGDAAVILRVTRTGNLEAREESTQALPVLPSVDAEALYVSHLASAARFMAPFSPTPRDNYSRLGLRGGGRLAGLRTRESDFANFPGYTLQLDPAEPFATPVAAARGQVWAWVALRVEGAEGIGMPPPPTKRPVELLRPFSRYRQMRADPMQDRLHLGEARDGDHAIAAWRTQQNESLDRMDLAYADNLLHRHGGNPFFPFDIRQEGDSIHIGGAPFRDRDNTESYLPILETELQVPAELRIKFSQISVAPDAMRWADLEVGEAAARLDAHIWIAGTFDAIGSPSMLSRSIPVHYPVRIGMLALGEMIAAPGSIQSDREEVTRASLIGKWITRRDRHARNQAEPMRKQPWPVLGMALTAALRESLHGLFDFTRLVAHRGAADGVNDHRAFVFFVEPAATMGTVPSVMRKLMLDSHMTKRMLQCAHSLLASISWNQPEPLARLMAEARVLVGAGWYEDTPEGLINAQADVAGALALLETVIAAVERTEQRGQRAKSQRNKAEG